MLEREKNGSSTFPEPEFVPLSETEDLERGLKIEWGMVRIGGEPNWVVYQETDLKNSQVCRGIFFLESKDGRVDYSVAFFPITSGFDSKICYRLAYWYSSRTPLAFKVEVKEVDKPLDPLGRLFYDYEGRFVSVQTMPLSFPNTQVEKILSQEGLEKGILGWEDRRRKLLRMYTDSFVKIIPESGNSFRFRGCTHDGWGIGEEEIGIYHFRDEVYWDETAYRILPSRINRNKLVVEVHSVTTNKLKRYLCFPKTIPSEQVLSLLASTQEVEWRGLPKIFPIRAGNNWPKMR